MTDLARLLLHVLTLAAGLAIGWTTRGWHDGSTVSSATADTQSVTESAVERVRYITRTVTAAPECPPGAGPVSDGLARELREAVR